MNAISMNLQILFAGLSVGAVYSLIALGFVLIIRATNVVNFAQGDFAMLGAFAMMSALTLLKLPFWLSFIVAMAAMAIFGVIFNFGVYYPLRNRSFLPVIISTLGASIFLQNTTLAIFGPQARPLEKAFNTPGFEIGGVFMDSQYLVILVVVVIAVTFQYFLFEHTLLGKKLQATAQDRVMARLLGIPVAKMIAITFIYSAMLGGLAGILVGPLAFVSIGMGSVLALKAFSATIIGGFGDVRGAIVGGLLLGIVENFGAAYISVSYKDAFAFILLFILILIRPQGIFGEKISEKA